MDSGCYRFTIYDSYGDGICCSYGNGSYDLFDDDGILIANGGDFGSSEFVDFCIEGDNTASISQSSNSFKIYPNPAQSILNIQSNMMFDGTIEILNALGEIMLVKNMNGIQSEIDINDLSSGAYFVVLQSRNTRQVMHLVVE